MRFAYVLPGLVTLTSIHFSASVGFCSNGFLGLQSGDICCESSCPECGGADSLLCYSRPEGDESCCALTIEISGVLCSTASKAPCIIDACINGVPGVQSGDICCENQCVTCGGLGCDLRPGGSDGCCGGVIQNSGDFCSSTSEAPCIIDDAFCSNGVPGVQDDGGDVCCETQCGTCGGFGCDLRPGGSRACCGGTIKNLGAKCSTTSGAPCIIDR